MSFLDLTSLFDCRASLRASRTFGTAAFPVLIFDKSTLRVEPAPSEAQHWSFAESASQCSESD